MTTSSEELILTIRCRIAIGIVIGRIKSYFTGFQRTKQLKRNMKYLLILLISLPCWVFAQLAPTPFVGQGPFFPVNAKAAIDNDLTTVKNQKGIPHGEIIEVRGTIHNPKGGVVSNAEVLIWQTDNNGNYDHPDAAKMMGKEKLELDHNFQYWGKTITDQNGNYYFKTIVPKPYLVGNLQRPAHIHFSVKHDKYKNLTMELHFPNDQYLEKDRITAHLDDEGHALLMAKITAPPKGYGPKIVGFNIVLENQ